MQNLRLKAKPFCYLNSLSLKNIYLLNVTTIYETHRVTFIRLARCIVQTFCCHWQSESAYQVLLIRLESEARKKNFAKKRSLLNSNFFLRKIIFSLKQISTSKLRVILSSFLLFPSIRPLLLSSHWLLQPLKNPTDLITVEGLWGKGGCQGADVF